MNDAPRRQAMLAEAQLSEAAVLTDAREGESAPTTSADNGAREALPAEARPMMAGPVAAEQGMASMAAEQALMPTDARPVAAPFEAGPAVIPAVAGPGATMPALPVGPISLEQLRSHIATSPACRVEGLITTAGVPGLEADEMVLLVVSGDMGQWRGTVLCQRAGVGGYVVEGASVIPAREPCDGDPAPVWTYLDYRAVVWSDAGGARRYRVEQREPAMATWHVSEDWQTGLWPETAGGVIDCLLWLKQKGRL